MEIRRYVFFFMKRCKLSLFFGSLSDFLYFQYNLYVSSRGIHSAKGCKSSSSNIARAVHDDVNALILLLFFGSFSEVHYYRYNPYRASRDILCTKGCKSSSSSNIVAEAVEDNLH